MSKNDEIVFRLDVETEEAEKKMKGLNEKVTNLANIDLSSLINSTKNLVLGYVGFKAILETTEFLLGSIFSAEQNRKIDAQFETLSQGAGLVSEKLKNALVEAAGGLAGESEVLMAANKSIIELGTNAERIPEIMNLARKISGAFGGDMIEIFNDLSFSAANLQTRLLKKYGIIIDTDKALKEYAKSIGSVVGALSEQEKQQAIVNKIIEVAYNKYGQHNEEVARTTKIVNQIKVLLKELRESFDAIIESKFGDFVYKGVTFVKNEIEKLNKKLRSDYTKSLTEANNAIEIYEERIKSLKEQISKQEKFEYFKYIRKNLDERLKEYQEKLNEAIEYKKKFEEEIRKKETVTEKPKDEQATRLRLEQEEKFISEFSKLQAEAVRVYETRIKTLTAIDADMVAKKVEMEKKLQSEVHSIRKNEQLTEEQKIRMIEEKNKIHKANLEQIEIQAHEQKIKHLEEMIKKSSDLVEAERFNEMMKFETKKMYDEQIRLIEENGFIDLETKNQMRVELENKLQAQLLEIQKNFEEQKLQIIQNSIQASNNAAEQFALGFEKAAMQAQKNLSDFGAHGQKTFGILTNHVANAFMKMGEGSKRGSEVMKEAMLGMIADIAQYYGTMMIAAGVFPPNPAALAAGAALLMLAGFLRSKAKGATAFNTGGVGGMGGGVEMGNVGLSGDIVKEQERKEKAFNITILGNYFETEQTKQRLLELMREASDATDFRYQKIGGGV